MKMKFFKVGFSAIVLLLAGCAVSDDPAEQGKSVMYTGTLRSLGEVLVEEKADYILESDDGNVYYIYSDFLDLDKEKYKNARVQISGEIVKITESGKEVIAIESIVPMTKEIIEKDVINDTVKKYQNLDIGFRIDGLTGFNVKEFQNQVVFEKGENSFTVTRFDNTTAVSLDDWLTLSNVPERMQVFIGQDKLKGYMYSKASNTPVYYVSRTNLYIYEIDLVFSDERSESELKTILNSFRFVPLRESDLFGKNSVGNDSAIEMEKVKAYFADHLAEIVPDYKDGRYSIVQYEFLNTQMEDTSTEGAGNYVYIVYGSEEVVRRILVSYEFSMNKISDAKVRATFKEGTVTDWELLDGEDKIKGFPTIIVKVAEGVSPVALLDGFRLFESAPFKFSVQYPSNWYVQGQSGKYLFNDAPLKGDYLISIEVQKKKIETILSDIPFSFEKSELVPGREVFIAHPKEGEKYGVYIIMSRKDGEEAYVLWSIASKEDLLKKMADTITEN